MGSARRPTCEPEQSDQPGQAPQVDPVGTPPWASLLLAEIKLLRQALERDVDGLLDLSEAAAYLRCDPRTVKRYVAAGLLKAAKIGNGRNGAIRFRRPDLERFVATRVR